MGVCQGVANRLAVLRPGDLDVKCVSIQLGRGSLLGLQQITRDGIHHAHLGSRHIHRFVLQEPPVIEGAQQLHVGRRPRPAHLDQPHSLLLE